MSNHEMINALGVFVCVCLVDDRERIWFGMSCLVFKSSRPALSSITAFSPFGGSFAASFPKAEWAGMSSLSTQQI